MEKLEIELIQAEKRAKELSEISAQSIVQTLQMTQKSISIVNL